MQEIEGSSRRKNSAKRGGISSKTYKSYRATYVHTCEASLINKNTYYEVSTLPVC
jgi:hypothetical protein